MIASVRRLHAVVTDPEVRAAIAAGWGRRLIHPTLYGCVLRALQADRAGLAKRIRAIVPPRHGDLHGAAETPETCPDCALERAARIVEGTVS